MSYKIKTVGPAEEFSTQYGSMKKYSLQFEGSDDWVKLNQKVDSPAPIAGQELEGTITDDPKWGKQFKKSPGNGGFAGSTGGRVSDPETRGSIERQSALKDAVEAVHNYHTHLAQELTDLDAYVVEIIATAKKFQAHLSNSSPQTTVKADDNLPPVSSYENMQ